MKYPLLASRHPALLPVGNRGVIKGHSSLSAPKTSTATRTAELPRQIKKVPEVSSAKVAAPQEEAVRLRPGLVLTVTVLVAGKKELEESSKRISDNGTITLPLLGTVSIKENDTLETLTAKLAKLYEDYFITPQVIVDFGRDDGLSPWGYVTVQGRVMKPGRIPIPATRDLTLSGAIQQAGGLGTSARDTAIRIQRKNVGGTVDTQELDLRAVGSRGELENDIRLYPDDVVYVPELIF